MRNDQEPNMEPNNTNFSAEDVSNYKIDLQVAFRDLLKKNQIQLNNVKG